METIGIVHIHCGGGSQAHLCQESGGKRVGAWVNVGGQATGFRV